MSLTSITVSLDPSPVTNTLEVGKKAKIKITTNEAVDVTALADITAVVFSDINIASYNPSQGIKPYVIYGLSIGTVDVTITASYSGFTDTQTFTLNVTTIGGGEGLTSLDSVLTSLSISSPVNSAPKDSILTPTVTYSADVTRYSNSPPAYSTVAAPGSSVLWTSSDASVATFSSDVLTHHDVGSTNITANYYGVGNTTTFTVTEPSITSIAVLPATYNIPVGLNHQYTATATYDNGKTANITSTAMWSSSPTSYVSITNGLVTGLATNVAPIAIKATQDSHEGTAQAYVVPAVPISLSISPKDETIPKGTIQEYTAIVTLSDGSTLNVSISADTTWQTDDPLISQFNQPQKNIAKGLLEGSTQISATYTFGGGSEELIEHTTLNVDPPAILSFDIIPKNPKIFRGESQQFHAHAIFTDGEREVTNSSLWHAESEQVALKGNPGEFIGTTLGQTEIRASYNPSATTILSVIDGIDDNYILTYHESNDDGFDRPITSFTRVIDSSPTALSASAQIDLGFTTTFDGFSCNKFVVTKFGSLFLGDSSLDIDSSFDTDPAQGTENIKYTSLIKNISQPNLVLLPWAGELGPVFSDVSHIDTTTENKQKIVKGIEPVPGQGLNFYDEVGGGVFVKIADFHPIKGRRTIIRWNCLTTSSVKLSEVLQASRVEFECSIYENGKIEFVHGNAEKLSLFNGTEKDYSIAAIWPTNSYTVKFKDFSPYLKNDPKNISIHGGAYFDGTISFISNLNSTLTNFNLTYFDSTLKSYLNWPLHNGKNGVFTFMPIPKRRKTLPKKEIKRLQGIKKEENKKCNTYDDRSTLAFVIDATNYPSNLPRFYASGIPGIAERQDVFTNDVIINKQIESSAAQNWIPSTKEYTSDPFSEINLYEQGKQTSFYLTGTSHTTIGEGFTQPLRSKSIIRMNMPLQVKTTLPDVTSSILFYNKHNKRFEIQKADSLRVVDKFNDLFPDDARLFGALGNHVSSGSKWNGTGFTNDSYIESIAVGSVSDTYTNLPFEIDNDYTALQQHVLQPEIQGPFLIEKVIFQIPLEAGPGWFEDVTKAYKKDWITAGTGEFNIANTDQIDIGGPAITAALHLQRSVPDELNSNVGKRRAVIAQAVITHENDVNAESPNFISTFSGTDINNFIVFMQGIKAFGVTPNAIVSPTVSGYFNGDVVCEATAVNGAGNLISLSANLLGEKNGATGPTSAGTGSLGLLLSSSISLYDDTTLPINSNVISIKPFGREHVGLNQFFDDRSVEGGKVQLGSILPSSSIKNPFAVPNAMQSGNKFNPLTTLKQTAIESAFFRGAILNESQNPSPFLIYPGESLVVSLSKTRPVFGEKDTNYTYAYSGSHDVKIGTGSLAVTLYGSYIRQGREIHPIKNEAGLTRAVQVAYGDSPVMDQFDVESTDSLIGSYIDSYVTGNISDKRGRAFSIFNKSADKSTALDDSTVSTSQSTPRTQAGGTFRNLLLVDNNEIFYDSLLPSIDDILLTDNTKLSYVKNEPYLSEQENVCIPVIFDYYDTWGYGNASIMSASNNVWTKSFPFEERYKNLPRKQYPIKNATIVNYEFDMSNPDIVTQLNEPKNGFKFSFRWPSETGNTFNCAIDQIEPLISLPDLIPCNDSDLIKTFYGFGDSNTRAYNPSGTVNFPSFAVNTDYGMIKSFTSSIGPVIRGWKYGIKNGFGTNTTCVWRRDRFGQFRDMLEQRLDTAFFKETEKSVTNSSKSTITEPVVSVKFYYKNEQTSRPEETQSSNITKGATSNLPYVDGEIRNRLTINIKDVYELNNVILL